MKSEQKGFYLLELLIAILLFVIVIMAALQSVMLSSNWLHHLSNRTSAFASIQERMEEILSDSYVEIIAENYPIDYPVITFGGLEFANDDIVGRRKVIIIPYDEYKEVIVTITWEEKGREEFESLYSLVAPR